MNGLAVSIEDCSPWGEEPIELSQARALASTLKALTAPARLRIISLLATKPKEGACVTDLCVQVGLKQGTVSHHMRILREAGMVVGKKMGVYVVYTLQPDRLSQVAGLLTLSKKQMAQMSKRGR